MWRLLPLWFSCQQKSRTIKVLHNLGFTENPAELYKPAKMSLKYHTVVWQNKTEFDYNSLPGVQACLEISLFMK